MIKGDGLLIREPTINPPKVREILKSIGNEKVQSILLVRTPLSKSTKFLLNVATLGQLENKMKTVGVDELFHLSMIINDKYTLEKNEVIRLYKQNKIPDGSLTLTVPVDTDFTIGEMLERTRQVMGDKYGSYDAVNNNCGIFLDNVLKANGTSNNASVDFLNQPTFELFKSFPQFSETIVKLGTTLGAVGSRVLEGEGKGKHSYTFHHHLGQTKLSF